jgi:hypothetical protein
MKKYIIGMLAIIMIAIASAFTITHKTAPAKQDPVTYWFQMDAQGNVTTTQLSDPSTLCPLPGDGCARQYNENQTQIVGGVRQVKASQVDLEIASRAKN